MSNLIPYAVVLLCIVVTTTADEPIPKGPDALTRHDFEKARFAIDTESCLEGYKKHGKRNDAWDDEAIHFMKMFVLCFSGAPNQPSMEQLKAAGKVVIDLGCDDPLVLFGYGYAIDRPTHRSGAEKHLVKAVAAFEGSQYPAYLYVAAASRLARFLEAWDRPEEAHAYHQIAANASIVAAEAAPDEYFPQRFLANNLKLQLKNYLPFDISETLIEGLQLVGGLNSCTLSTCMGVYHDRVGWEARGDGFANTVTEKGWEIFAKHQEISRSYLVKAHELDPSRPEAASLMISIATAGYAGPGESERFWFDKAVAAQMDWPPAYTRILWSMRPRWGGSHEEMFEFGLECARTERFDTYVPYELIGILLDIDKEQQYSKRFWRLNRIYPIANPILEQLVLNPAHKHDILEYRTIQVGMAWVMHEFVDAKKMLDQANNELDEAWLINQNMSARKILDDVHIFTSNFADKITAADKLSSVKNFKGAVNAYDEIIKQIEDDPALMVILRDRLVTAEIETQFKTGEWVDLKFEEGNPGWRARGGIWHSSSPEIIKGGPQFNGLFLISKFAVGDQFELSGKIDMSNLRRRNDSDAAIVFQHSDNVKSDNSHWLAFQIYARQKRAWIGNRFWKGSGQYLPLGKRRIYVYDFHLKNWGEEAVLYLNSTLVFSGKIKIHSSFKSGQSIGLAGSYATASAGYALYENLKLRKLNERPEELNAIKP